MVEHANSGAPVLNPTTAGTDTANSNIVCRQISYYNTHFYYLLSY